MNSLFATLIVALQSLSKRSVYLYSVVSILAIISIVIGCSILARMYQIEKPVFGGIIREGVIGSPYAINPVLATSQTDKDLVALVYSGLMRELPNGELVHDLAEEHNVSTDKLTYTFTLKNNVFFHDGVPVTAEDVVYTIEKIQDANLRSPQAIKWERIEVRAIDERTVQFALRRPFPGFLKNTTIGILPKHLFEQNPNAFSVVNYNTEPIGSGPFKVVSVARVQGIPSQYTLVRNTEFSLGVPFIEKIIVTVFDSETTLLQALKNGTINHAAAITPREAVPFTEHPDLHVLYSPLPRLFAIFLNQNKVPALTDIRVREALTLAIDKSLMTFPTFQGFGTPINGPFPANDNADQNNVTPGDKAKARELLTQAGWVKNEAGFLTKNNQELVIHIATPNIGELVTIANFIKASWEEVGVKTFVDIFSIGDLQDLVIRDRSFDSVLYGILVDEETDLYAYWHSSQRQAPGLNVAQYANKQVDALLESYQKEASETVLSEIISRIEKDFPAIFLFSPSFIYVVEENRKSQTLTGIKSPEDRFKDIHTSYVYTERIWPGLRSLPFIQNIESFIHSL